MNIIEFGDALLRTGDLDPVYTAISKAKLDQHTLHRLSLAYWCLYHLGAASRLAEIKQPAKFWATLREAAVNEGLRWPRGSERRHFRAAIAVTSVNSLISKYKTPSDAVAGFIGPVQFAPTYASVAAAVQSHHGFGPWIAFKVADMSERVLGCATDFTDCHLGIYKDPRQGAAVGLLEWSPHDEAREYEGRCGLDAKPWDYPITDAELKLTVDHYIQLWRKKRAKAPPTGDRLVNVQEIETIFCKYKSHLKGHYPMGKDTREIAHGLTGWGDLAQQLKKGLPSGT